MRLLRALPLKPWAACRREDLLALLASLDRHIGKLDAAVLAAAQHVWSARNARVYPESAVIPS